MIMGQGRSAGIPGTNKMLRFAGLSAEAKPLRLEMPCLFGFTHFRTQNRYALLLEML